MADYVTSQITLGFESADARQEFIDTYFINGEFHFDKLIPIPESFKDMHQGYVDIDGKFHTVWRMDSDNNPIAVPQQELEALKTQYGTYEPVDWAIKYWGCKWNGDILIDDYQFSEKEIINERGKPATLYRMIVEIDTPWSTPDEVINHLIDYAEEYGLLLINAERYSYNSYGSMIKF